jgi:hypothetical protein
MVEQPDYPAQEAYVLASDYDVLRKHADALAESLTMCLDVLADQLGDLSLVEETDSPEAEAWCVGQRALATYRLHIHGNENNLWQESCT